MPTEGLPPEVTFSCLRGLNLMEVSGHCSEGLVWLLVQPLGPRVQEQVQPLPCIG